MGVAALVGVVEVMAGLLFVSKPSSVDRFSAAMSWSQMIHSWGEDCSAS